MRHFLDIFADAKIGVLLRPRPRFLAEAWVLLSGKIIKHYAPPSTVDLEALKTRLNKTGNDMANIAGLPDGRQWRKCTGGASPREVSVQMLFSLLPG
jgi:hypothetical protein